MSPASGFAIQEIKEGCRILIHILEPGIGEDKALLEATRMLQVEVLRRGIRKYR